MRYHKKVFFPEGADAQLKTFTDTLNTKAFTYSAHCLDNIKYRTIDIESLLRYIKGIKLNNINIFEFYTDDKGNIIKACFRLDYSLFDVILVISKEKNIITIYTNNKEDKHSTLNEALYMKG
jgi:hypothetical protein